MTSAIDPSGNSSINPYEEGRPWGNFRQFAKDAPCTVKIITVNPGAMLSLQSHEGRAEFWHVLGGEGTVEIDGAISEARKGDEYAIPQGAKHRLAASDGSTLEILEIATGHFDEGDIVRYEDKYGRA